MKPWLRAYRPKSDNALSPPVHLFRAIQKAASPTLSRVSAASTVLRCQSVIALTHYNALKALKAAWERSGSISPEAGKTGLAGLTFDSPTGPVTIDATHHHATMNIVVAKGSEAGLQVVKRLGQVAAEPGCG